MVILRRAVTAVVFLPAVACGLGVIGVQPEDSGDAGPVLDGAARQDASRDELDAEDDRDPPRVQDPDADPPTSDAGEVFSADAGPDAGPPPSCVKRALLLVDKEPTTESAMTAALGAAGFTVSAIADYSRSNGEGVAAFDPRVVVILAGVNYRLDMTTSLQAAVKTALMGGAGLVTEEWAGYEIVHSHFQTIAPYILFSYSTYTNAVTIELARTVDHPIWTGLPASFKSAKKLALGVGKPRGSASQTIASASSGSGGTQPGVIVQDNGKTRVAETTIAVDYYRDDSLNQDPNLRRLFVNMALWAAHCEVTP